MSRYPASCTCEVCAKDRAARVEVVKRLHDERRSADRCIAHPRRKAYRGGRCRQCWKKKLAAERARYAEARAGIR